MPDPNPSFFTRIALAFKVLFSAELARRVTASPERALPPPEPVAPPARVERATPDAALQLLALLQREGRLVDFLQEDVSSFSDAEVGAAARVVHQGCAKALREHLDLRPIRQEDEGTKLTLEAGFDAALVRLTGNVVGEPPYRGTLQHRGWRATRIELPKLAEAHDVHVLAPAEVEL